MPPSQLSAAWPRRPLTLCPQVLRAEHFQGWRAHYQAKKGSQCKLGSHLLSPTLHLPLHRTGRGESAELAFPQGAAGGEPVSRHTRMCLETVVVPQFWRALAETPGHGVDRRGDSGFWGAFGGQAQARQTSEPLACLPHPPMPPPPQEHLLLSRMHPWAICCPLPTEAQSQERAEAQWLGAGSAGTEPLAIPRRGHTEAKGESPRLVRSVETCSRCPKRPAQGWPPQQAPGWQTLKSNYSPSRE